jgi:PAS domain S-box-containing protein
MIKSMPDTVWHSDTLEGVLQSVRCAVLIADVTENKCRIVHANVASEAVTGFCADELLSRSLLDKELLASEPAERQAIERAMRCCATVERVVLGRRKDGVRQWRRLRLFPAFDASGKASHYVAVLSLSAFDATAKQSYDESEARLDALFALSPDGLVVSDSKGRAEMVNAAFGRILCELPSRLVGQPVLELEQALKSLADASRPWPPLAQLFEGSVDWLGSAEVTSEATLCEERRRFPRQTLVLNCHERKVFERSACRLSPLDPGRIAFYYRDVTREHDIARLKTQFLSTAAHELRTPLSTIVGFSEILMAQRTSSIDEAAEYANLIHDQSLELARLLDELLDLARIESSGLRSFKLSSTPIGRFVSEFLATLSRDPRFERVRLISECPESVIVDIDADKLGQALRNLISNGVKFSDDVTPVLIKLDVVEDNGPGYVRICVEDRGIGIAADDLDKLFNPFFRAQNASGVSGTGLGLVLVKEIMRHHKGVVGVRSNIGAGTTVELKLPLSELGAAGTKSSKANKKFG